MATSLAAQLAQISAKSKSSLNVKTQKAAHSKSLIFEPRVAAAQSFQTIYTLCHDGFEELCRLDGRFSHFSATLFSEQSQEEDRTQMNAAENVQLDQAVGSFLRLCGGKLRLMPAIKAVEWLIRRFRADEYNTAVLIATFLPYHASPVFVTLMSILPPNIPHEYRFLDPYIRSLTPPPRAAIVRHATHHPELLGALSSYMLEACREQNHHPALISFWGGITTEAVNAVIDSTKSGRKSVQADQDQALLRRIGPTLAEALAMKKVPGLQIASYMVIAVFVSKTGLGDSALTAFMENLVMGWTVDTLRPGLVCLSILAQYRSAKRLPGKVTKALLKTDGVPRLLSELGKEHRVDRLASGLVLSLVDRLVKKGAVRGLPIVKTVLLSNILGNDQIQVASRALLDAGRRLSEENGAQGDALHQLGLCLISLSQDGGETGKTVRKVIEDADFDLEKLELNIGASLRPKALIATTQDDDAMKDAADAVDAAEDLASALNQLSGLGCSVSCLAEGSDTIFGELAGLLLTVASDREGLQKFDSSPPLGRHEAVTGAFYLSFYARIWSGAYPILARVAALELAKNRLGEKDCENVDFQALIPYCIAAMGDPVKKVRRAAADLLIALDGNTLPKNGERPPNFRWASKQLYGESTGSSDLAWLSTEALTVLLRNLLIPSTEEATIDEHYLSAALQGFLSTSKKGISGGTEPATGPRASAAVKLSITTFLASHALYTPLLRLALRLLQPLNQVKGVSGTSRTDLLPDFLHWWAGLSAENARKAALQESLDESIVDSAAVSIVAPGDKAGLQLLLKIVKSPGAKDRSGLTRSVFSRIQHMWPSLKREAQASVAEAALDLFDPQTTEAEENTMVSEEAADLLRNVWLSTDILSSFLGSLLEQASVALAEAPQPNKRRRTSDSGQSRGVLTAVPPELKSALRRMAFVLQLLEGSSPAEHPELFNDLFMVLSDLQILKAFAGSELGYLQNLALGSLVAMMPAFKDKSKKLVIDTSVSHGDVLTNIIRKSSSPAVQNVALLLVASMANSAPDIILHCVMPIFTFMSGSVLQQSDDYSAHVVHQTINEVIPPLIETFRKGRRNVVASAAELLSSFVVAYEHIPSHRKRDLFVSLVKNLGPSEFLFAVIALFADRFGAGDSIVAFLLDLMNSFSAEVQLQAMVALVDLVGDIFRPKPGLSSVLLGKKDEPDQGLPRAAVKELTILPRLLSSKLLRADIGRLTERDDMEAAKIRELYAALLEGILTLADAVKTRKPLHTRCGDALANLLNLLSTAEFIKAVETLLGRPNVSLRQKVLRALEVRVDEEGRTDTQSRAALLAFLPELTAVIRNSDDIAYKHTAVTCVDKIAEKYGKKDLEAVTAAAATIAGDHCLGQTDRRLRIVALLCLASLVDVLQDAMVPVLPVALPKALAHLETSIDGLDSDAGLHNAAYAFVTALGQYLPYMVSEAHLGQLFASSNKSAEAGMDDEANENRRQCLQLIARQVDAKVMFAALRQNWHLAQEAGYSALGEYLEMLRIALDRHPKSAIAKNLAPLSAIFQSALDLRRVEYARDHTSRQADQRIAVLEDAANVVALKMIYKLNDGAFRPVFSQLLEWSVSKTPGVDSRGRAVRQESVFGFLLFFFDKLKSIVTSYATYVIDSAVGVLQSADLTTGEQRELWKRVLRTLAKCFEHDQEDFWQTPSHFDAVAPALLGQFLHAPTMDVSEELVPAVVELAAAAHSQEHRKELNGGILAHLRSGRAAVRLAAVKCEQALTDRLGEEWLEMLPEMLPYISELQDDDDEVVDRETHRWIVKIEGVLGESLDAMLQ